MILMALNVKVGGFGTQVLQRNGKVAVVQGLAFTLTLVGRGAEWNRKKNFR
jgi:hypothetical protein